MQRFPKPQKWQLKANKPTVLLAILITTLLAARLFTIPLLVGYFKVPDPSLPEPLTGSKVERAGQIQVPLQEISPAMSLAMVEAEDRRFYRHHGIDLLGAVRATLDNARAGKMVEGGSTITQQLAKNVFLDYREKTAHRKIQQLVLAWELEDRYTKQRILECYLNRIYFGCGCYGVESASQYYFGKAAKDLDLAEAAFLAGLVKSPSQSGLPSHRKQALARQEEILSRIRADGLGGKNVVAEAMAEKLQILH